MNTNEQTMAWIMDTYSMHVRRRRPPSSRASRSSLGGSRGPHARRPAAACMFICREALKKLGMRPQNARVVVQGSGNVGGIGAMLLHREGYKIVA